MRFMKPELGAAKQRLLDFLKQAGPATAGDVADVIGVSGVAIRQHLNALETLGLITSESESPDGRGRPARRWSLTELAQRLFPDRHGELTVALLAATRRAVGDAGLDRILDARANDQVKAYRRRMPGATAPLRRRVDALARIRSEEGYMAEVRRDTAGAYLLIEHHCPICDAARQCQGLCRTELDVFRRALGTRVSVERTRHALSGDTRCVYRIRPAR